MGFKTPYLHLCLRNGREIALYATGDSFPTSYHTFDKGLSLTDTGVEGFLGDIKTIWPNTTMALKDAFTALPGVKKSLVIINAKTENQISKTDLIEEFPEETFTDFGETGALASWIASKNPSHLIIQRYSPAHTDEAFKDLIGSEWDTIFLVVSGCKTCGFDRAISSLTSRAKAALVVARYKIERCFKCPHNLPGIPKIVHNM